MNFRRTSLVMTALLLIAAVSLSGCRPSHRLEKIRYTADADVIDEDQEQIDMEEDGRIEDYLSNVKEQEALKQLADDMEIGPEDDASHNNSDSSRIIYNTAGDDDQAQDKDAQKDPNAIYRDFGKEEIENVAAARAADVGTSKLIADATGIEVELPKNVRKATAVGVAAQLVELVSGSGRLAACDSDLSANEFAQLVMTDLSSVKQWWDGDGSVIPISDENFEKLLMDPEIDVCFEISGQETFTEEQISSLEEYGISYVALYPVNTVENLKMDAEIIGQVMTNGNGDKNDSVSRAKSYTDWVDSTLKGASEAAGKYERYTVYITGWDDSATYRLTLSDNNPFPDSDDVDADFGLTDGKGSSLAYAYTYNADEMFTELASFANVTNTSTLSTARISSAENTNYVYVTPVFESFRAGGGQSINGQFSYYSGNINAGYTPFLYRTIGSTSVVALGTGDYPAVIASSEDVMNRIGEDPFWNYAGYCGPLYLGSFYVYANPSGIESWAEGGIESPLEAKWLACRICQAYTQEEILAEAVSFYSQFFFAGDPPEETERQLIEIIEQQLKTFIKMER